MGNLLEVIRLPVSPIVHGVNIPGISCAVVVCMDDAVQNWIPHVHVWRSHVDLSTKQVGSWCKFSIFHALKQVQILGNGSIPKWARRTWASRRAFLFGDLLRGLLIYIGFALLDQQDRPVVQLLKIIRGIAFVGPVKSQPGDIALDGINIFLFFLGRICIVKSKVNRSAVFLTQTEV